MTKEETELTIDYLKSMQEEYIEGEGYERYPLPEWYALDKAIELLEQTRWIPISERLPKLDEEACSKDVLISLRETTWDLDECKEIHITKIAYYDESAISSDGIYMDTEGWVLEDGSTLSMDEVIAWQPLPQPYAESGDVMKY